MELKPCMRCRDDLNIAIDERESKDDNTEYAVVCLTCGGRSVWVGNKEAAIWLWNKRGY